MLKAVPVKKCKIDIFDVYFYQKVGKVVEEVDLSTSLNLLFCSVDNLTLAITLS